MWYFSRKMVVSYFRLKMIQHLKRGSIASAMNVCLKARDSLANR